MEQESVMSDYQEDLIASQFEEFDDDIEQDDATEL
jgi:hypothetical protein